MSTFQKEELIGIIEKLLGDRTTLVVGSAVMAFEEVCPERIELIHKNYRKLCNLLVDVDEWGQVRTSHSAQYCHNVTVLNFHRTILLKFLAKSNCT